MIERLFDEYVYLYTYVDVQNEKYTKVFKIQVQTYLN